MGPRVNLRAFGVPAHQVGSDREPLEIVGLERRLTIGGRQLGVDVPPGLPAE